MNTKTKNKIAKIEKLLRELDNSFEIGSEQWFNVARAKKALRAIEEEPVSTSYRWVGGATKPLPLAEPINHPVGGES